MGKADPGPDGLPGLRFFHALKGPRHGLRGLTWRRTASISGRTHQIRLDLSLAVPSIDFSRSSRAKLASIRSGRSCKRWQLYTCSSKKWLKHETFGMEASAKANTRPRTRMRRFLEGKPLRVLMSFFFCFNN